MAFKKKLLSIERHLVKKVSSAIIKYKLIEDGDNILIAHSGGKDSWALLHFLHLIKRFAPVSFDYGVIVLNQGIDSSLYTNIINRITNDYTKNVFLKETNIFNIVREKIYPPNKIPCALCSRLRRGFLFRFANNYGYNKVALGHHKDDFIETLLLNLFFNAKFDTILPKLIVEKGIVIRPLIFIREADISRLVRKLGFPVLNTDCPLLSEYPNDSKRAIVKNIISILEKKNKHIPNSIFNAFFVEE